MTYQVFARKWRPQQFGDMIGQSHVVKALTNALDNDRLHHAYLFTGMRGVGKTTIARVLAKSLNCETNGVSANPCGECPTCVDIEAGRFFDLIEVDAASRTRVDETRELLENVPYAPSSGRYKVYLIDEVHMFSNHSFNALLKTLEEPPPHVKFILATTDPQKVPVTILSRCLQFSLKRIPEQELVAYLSQLLDAEKITWEDSALVHIARASEGSVRDSLSLVEQAAAFGGGQVTTSEVESMLGRLSPDRVFDLVDAVADGDGARVMQQIESLAEYAPDYALLLKEIMAVLHQVAVCQVTQATPSGLYANRITALAAGQSASDIQLYYQIGLHGRRDMPYSVDAQTALEMTLLRMVAFRPVTDPAGAAGQSSSRGSDTASVPVASTVARTAASTVISNTVQAAVESGAKHTSAETQVTAPKREPRRAAAPAPASQHDAATVGGQHADIAPIAAPASNTPAAHGNKPEAVKQANSGSVINFSPEQWPSTVETLGLTGMPKQLARHTTVGTFDNDHLTLVLAPGHDHLSSPRFIKRLEQAVGDMAGRAISVAIDVGDTAVVTPAVLEKRAEDNAMQSARDSIATDPMVQVIVDTVDGVVDESSVEPLGDYRVKPTSE